MLIGHKLFLTLHYAQIESYYSTLPCKNFFNYRSQRITMMSPINQQNTRNYSVGNFVIPNCRNLKHFSGSFYNHMFFLNILGLIKFNHIFIKKDVWRVRWIEIKSKCYQYIYFCN